MWVLPLIQQDKEIGMQLRIVSNKLKYNAARLIGFDCDSLSTVQHWIIAFLFSNRNHAVYQKDIEAAFGFNRSTASQTIRAMEKHNLIERMSVPDDARLKQIVLTDYAASLHKSKLDNINKFENQLLNGLSESDIANLFRYIDLINSNLDSMAYTNR